MNKSHAMVSRLYHQNPYFLDQTPWAKLINKDMGLWYVEGRGYLCVNGDKVIIIKNNKRYTLQAMEPGEPCVVVDIEPYELSQKKHPGIYLRARGAKML